MPKARIHPDQLGFTFEEPIAREGAAGLAGLEAMICRTVGSILNSDSRPREYIAADMSILLGEDVSKSMLDAYSSPARTEHRVPMSRFFALVLVTKRHDLMDPLLREIGMAGLIGAEVKTARLGQIDREIARLRDERTKLAVNAPLIRGDQFQ